MIRTTGSLELLRALRQWGPDVTFSVSSEMPWHSLKFGGTQLHFSALIVGEKHKQNAQAFAAALPEHQFILADLFVADIIATEPISGQNETHLSIVALLFAND